MRILLDESVPRPLAALLLGHDVRTVTQMGWTGLGNGDLLRQATPTFDALLTADQNIETKPSDIADGRSGVGRDEQST